MEQSDVVTMKVMTRAISTKTFSTPMPERSLQAIAVSLV